MGEVGVVVFLLGGWTLAPKRKRLKIGFENLHFFLGTLENHRVRTLED